MPGIQAPSVYPVTQSSLFLVLIIFCIIFISAEAVLLPMAHQTYLADTAALPERLLLRLFDCIQKKVALNASLLNTSLCVCIR